MSYNNYLVTLRLQIAYDPHDTGNMFSQYAVKVIARHIDDFHTLCRHGSPEGPRVGNPLKKIRGKKVHQRPLVWIRRIGLGGAYGSLKQPVLMNEVLKGYLVGEQIMRSDVIEYGSYAVIQAHGHERFQLHGIGDNVRLLQYTKNRIVLETGIDVHGQKIGSQIHEQQAELVGKGCTRRTRIESQQMLHLYALPLKLHRQFIPQHPANAEARNRNAYAWPAAYKIQHTLCPVGRKFFHSTQRFNASVVFPRKDTAVEVRFIPAGTGKVGENLAYSAPALDRKSVV